MRRPVWLIIICIICAGCAPVGDIGGSTAAQEEFWVVPYRVVYDWGDFFWRDTDLGVFISYYGYLQPVPIKDVEISIVERPIVSKEGITVEAEYEFKKTAGRKLVIVSYKNYRSIEYSIEVQDPFGLADLPGIVVGRGEGDERPGSTIIWKYPGKNGK